MTERRIRGMMMRLCEHARDKVRSVRSRIVVMFGRGV
jgi:hypothetical protein